MQILTGGRARRTRRIERAGRPEGFLQLHLPVDRGGRAGLPVRGGSAAGLLRAGPALGVVILHRHSGDGRGGGVRVLAQPHRKVPQHFVHLVWRLRCEGGVGVAPGGLDAGELRGPVTGHARQPFLDRRSALVIIKAEGVLPSLRRVDLDGLLQPLAQGHPFAKGGVSGRLTRVGIDAFDAPWDGSAHFESVFDADEGLPQSSRQTWSGLIVWVAMG